LDPESDEIAAYDWTDLQGRMHPKVPVQDVLHFRDLDASDGLFGYPRLAAAISDVAADSEATEYVREIVSNHGQPGAIAKVKGYTSKSDLLAAEESFNERFQARGNRGRTFFMNVEDMELTPVGFNLSELEFPDLRWIAREDICSAAGVDPRIIGVGSAAKDGGLSGEQYQEARFRLIQQSVMPVMKAMEADINCWLAPEFGDLYVRFDPDVLSELTEDEGETSTRGLAELTAAAITVEEYRELTGRDAEMDPDQHLAHSITVQWKTVDEANNPPEPVMDPGMGLDSPTPPSSLPRTRVMRRGDVLTSDERLALWRSFDQAAEREEARYKRTALTRFRAEAKDVVALVAEMDQGQRADPIMDALIRALTQRFTKGGEYEQAWVNAYVELLTATFRRSGERLMATVGVSFDVLNPRVMAAIRNRAEGLALFVTEDTANRITAVIEQGRASGLGMREIAAQIKETVYGDEITTTRATRIARTETVGAMNEGEYQTATISGVMQSKEWLTQGDSRVRDSHENLDGVRIPIGQAFANGCQHPGDRRGGPAETINCRCTLLYYDEEAPA
jgi:HK97 family phage portal protein